MAQPLAYLAPGPALALLGWQSQAAVPGDALDQRGVGSRLCSGHQAGPHIPGLVSTAKAESPVGELNSQQG